MDETLDDLPDKDDPQAIIKWCKEEIAEYEKLIELVGRNKKLKE